MEALAALKARVRSLESQARSLELQGATLDDRLRELRLPMNYAQLEWRESLPSQQEKIWKDECCLSFATPFSPGGLFVNLKTLTTYSLTHVKQDWNNQACKSVYLRQQWIWIPDEDEKGETKQPEVKKLAIGTEGGFQMETEKGTIKKVYSFATGPKFTEDYALESAPESLQRLAHFVIKKDDASRQMDVMAWEASNDLIESKYARALIQVDNGVKLSPDPKTWKCADSGMTENLWLNLSTGHIGSGRPNWDGTGGTGAALRHYEETGGIYPLVVKLGTITPDGKADVYSYAPDEDCMVLDPLLAQHLAHFDINVGEMRKTEKTIAEMEVDLNVKYDWSRLSEEGKTLEKIAGPHCVGLVNLGNSCYCNSVFQSIFASQPFTRNVLTLAQTYPVPSKPQFDVLQQLIKLGSAFEDPVTNLRALSHKPFEGTDSLSPRMLKTLLGEGHREFSTGEQQDAADYYRHVLDRLESAFKANTAVKDLDVTPLFALEVEERTQCMQTNQVRYKRATTNMLPLVVPYTPPSSNEASTKEKQRDTVSFEACLDATFNSSEVVDDFLSPATGIKGQALRTQKIAQYPRLLCVQLKRFVLAPSGWQGIKLECAIPAPVSISLGGSYQGKGLQPDEVALPEDTARTEPQFIPDPQVVDAVSGFGFSREGAIRAAKATNNNLEAAVNWAMDHSGDADFNEPLPQPSSTNGKPAKEQEEVISEEILAQIMSMGFSREGAIRACRATGSDPEAAVMWALNHSGDADFNDPIVASSAAAEPPSDAMNADQEEQLAMLMSMGYDPAVAKFVFVQAKFDFDQALGKLMASTPDDLQREMEQQQAPSAATTVTQQQSPSASSYTGSTQYHLRAVVSHVGRSTMSGHYVTHVNVKGPGEAPKWVFFNDDKVVVAQDPPLDMGYLLFFERVD